MIRIDKSNGKDKTIKITTHEKNGIIIVDKIEDITYTCNKCGKNVGKCGNCWAKNERRT